MADLGQMELSVTADISKLKSAMDAAGGSTLKFAGIANNSLNSFGNTLKNVSNSSGQSIFHLTEKLRELESSVFTEKSKIKIASFNAQIEKTKNEINKLSNVGKTGFDELGNSIEKVGNPISKAYSGLRQLAFILPGIGIAGIFNLGFEALSAFVSKLEGATSAQTNLNNAFAEARASVSGSVTELRSLVAIAQDVTLSDSARTQAIKELNKEYPELHKNLTLENINTKNITNAIDHQIEAIKRRSQAKAIEKLIDDESLKVEKLKINGPSFFEGLPAQLSDFFGSLSNTLGASGLVGTEQAVHKAFVDPIKEGEKNIEIYSKKLLELNTEAAKAGDLFTGDKHSKAAKTAKEVETITSNIEKLDRQLALLSQEEIIFKTDKFKEKISDVENTIKHLVDKFKLSANNTVVLELEARINEIKLKERLKFINNRFQPEPIPFEIQFDGQQIKERLEEAYKTQFAPNKQNDPVQKLNLSPYSNAGDVKRAAQEAELAGAGISKAYAHGLGTVKFDEFYEKTQKFFAQVGTLLRNTLVDSLTGVGESLGKALTGEKGNLFTGLFQVFAQGLKSFGKALIEYGISLKVIKQAFKNPTTAIIAGVGLIAAGAALAASLPKFATGVENFRGGVAVVGERGPELVRLPRGSDVIPNRAIGNFSGGSQVFIPNVTLRGQDLVVAFNRTNQTNNRNN